jgi:hemerythrin-like metal-binding protein
MSLVEWREEFNLGVVSVDHEHRELIALINKVHEKMAEPGSDVTIAEYLGEIYARIAAHFALEERLMRERNYDRLDEHKADHERLLDDIRDIMDDYEDRRLYDESRFATRLTFWFTEHFKTHDARLHHYLPH